MIHRPPKKVVDGPSTPFEIAAPSSSSVMKQLSSLGR
jgi:hypothetical protein